MLLRNVEEELDEDGVEEEEDEDGATTASLKHFQVTTSQPGGVTRRLQWDETGEESLHRPEWRECSGRSFHFLCFSATRPSWPGPGSSSVRGCPPTNKQIFPQYMYVGGCPGPTGAGQVAAKGGRRPPDKCRLHGLPKHL